MVFAVCGLAGGMIAAILALATIPDGHTSSTFVELGPFPLLVGSAAFAGGVVSGWFVAILVLTRSRGGVRCPRCGTTNPRGFAVCRACELGPQT